jgi:competence protein ComEC
MAPATEGPSSGGGSTARHRGTAPGRAASRAAIAALVVAIAVTGGVVAARPAGIARISILDVGQGDAILVEGSKGGRLLIDGGPDPGRLLVVLDRRVPPWDRRIDALILTHPHEDHVAGLALLLERYHVGRVFEPGMIGPGPGYAAWQRTLAAIGSAARATLAAGDRLAVDEIAFKVLWPIRGQVPTTPPDGGTGINNVSVVLLGQIGERRVLLMGDVEEGIDPSLLKDDLPHVDLLKVAHHGSKTATTQAFVDAVRPTVAVASAGTRNPYGHPAQSTLDRLAASGARVLRTDLDGTVVVGFEPGGMTVRAEGGRPSADVRRQPPTAVSAVASKAPAVASRASTFLCAVPVAGLVAPTRQPAAASSADDRRAAAPDAGRGRTVGYHRADDGAWAGGGRLPPALPRSTLLGRAGRPCHRRPDRRIDRPARRSSDARCSTRPCVGFDPAGRGAPPAEPLQRSSRPPPALG